MSESGPENLDYSAIPEAPDNSKELQKQRELLESSRLTKEELTDLREKMLYSGGWTQEYEMSESEADPQIARTLMEYSLVPKSIIGSVDAAAFKEDAYFDDIGGFARLYDTANLMESYSEFFTDQSNTRYQELKDVIADISTMTTPEALAEKYQAEGKMDLLTGVNGAYNLLLAASRSMDVCPVAYLQMLKDDEAMGEWNHKIVDLQIGARQGAEYRFGHVEVDYPDEIVALNELIDLYVDVMSTLQAPDFMEKNGDALGESEMKELYDGLLKYKNLTPQYQEVFFWLNKRYIEYSAENEDPNLRFYHINMVTAHMDQVTREPYRSDQEFVAELEKSAKWLVDNEIPFPPVSLPEDADLPDGMDNFITLVG